MVTSDSLQMSMKITLMNDLLIITNAYYVYALYANAFPIPREKKSVAFLAHIYRRSAARALPAWFYTRICRSLSLLVFLSPFQLPSRTLLMSVTKQNEKEIKGRCRGRGRANSHVLKSCNGKYVCLIQFDHKHSYVCSCFFHTEKVLCLGCLDVDPLFDTFVPLFVCVLTLCGRATCTISFWWPEPQVIEKQMSVGGRCLCGVCAERWSPLYAVWR